MKVFENVNEFKIRLKSLGVLKKTYKVLFLFIVFTIAYSYTGALGYLETQVGQKLSFLNRELFNGDRPRVNSSLKIIAMDDNSVSKMKSPNLTIEQWQEFISILSAQKPNTIIIDKAFNLLDIQEKEEENSDESSLPFFDRLRKKKDEKPKSFDRKDIPRSVKIISAGYYKHSEVEGKDSLIADKHLNKHLIDLDRCSSNTCPEKRLFGYGPNKIVSKLFDGVGHVNYEKTYSFKPVVRLTKEKGLAHASLLTSEVSVLSDCIMVRKKCLPLTDEGELLIDYLPLKAIVHENRTKPFLRAMEMHKHGNLASFIKEGDTILVLPNAFSGSTDFHTGPLGKAPGGYILASMINSTLNGNWLKSFGQKTLFFFVFILIGATIAFYFQSVSSSVACFLILLAAVGFAGLWIFSNYGITMPWFTCSVGISTSYLITMLTRFMVSEAERNVINNSLSGTVPSHYLPKLAKSRALFSLEPEEKEMTFLMIDVKGYTLTAKKMTPMEGAKFIFDYMSDILEIVFKYNGILEKDLGDGLFVKFGFDFPGIPGDKDHAERAIKCSIEIQEMILNRVLRGNEKSGFNPVRIGVDTGKVISSNHSVDSLLRIKSTGLPIIIATRLEHACDPYRIMISQATVKKMQEDLELITIERHVNIKHASGLVSAFEIDPLKARSDEVKKAMSLYYESLDFRQESSEYIDLSEARIKAFSEMGEGELVNVSENGIGLIFPKYLGGGVSFPVKIGDFSKKETLTLSVVNGRPMGSNFYLGCTFLLAPPLGWKKYIDQHRNKDYYN